MYVKNTPKIKKNTVNYIKAVGLKFQQDTSAGNQDPKKGLSTLLYDIAQVGVQACTASTRI